MTSLLDPGLATPRVPWRRAAAVLVMAAVACAFARPASAAATVHRDTITTSFSDSGLPDDCRAGLTGTIVGTDVLAYQEVQTASGYHFEATDTGTARITWSDGSYSLTESVDHPAFNAGPGTTVFTNAHEDSGNTYAADGTFLFRQTFHLVEHVTVEAGVVRVTFERSRLHVFGGC